MTLAKTPRAPSKSCCHFDSFDHTQGWLREKSFLDPSDFLGMTGFGPSPLRLSAFAGDTPRLSCGAATLGALTVTKIIG
jgi:hypothetical protein